MRRKLQNLDAEVNYYEILFSYFKYSPFTLQYTVRVSTRESH